MKKTPQKPNQKVEIASAKEAAKKAAAASETFRKFMPNQQRNKNNSSVGPSWGGRKGN